MVGSHSSCPVDRSEIYYDKMRVEDYRIILSEMRRLERKYHADVDPEWWRHEKE